MFRSKITILIMLISVACCCMFLCIGEGRGSVWIYPTILSIIGLIFIIIKNYKKQEEQ